MCGRVCVLNLTSAQTSSRYQRNWGLGGLFRFHPTFSRPLTSQVRRVNPGWIEGPKWLYQLDWTKNSGPVEWNWGGRLSRDQVSPQNEASAGYWCYRTPANWFGCFPSIVFRGGMFRERGKKTDTTATGYRKRLFFILSFPHGWVSCRSPRNAKRAQRFPGAGHGPHIFDKICSMSSLHWFPDRRQMACSTCPPCIVQHLASQKTAQKGTGKRIQGLVQGSRTLDCR